jgi:hypothetical protein
MTHPPRPPYRRLPVALVLGCAVTLPAFAAPFSIMSDEEIARHTAAMAELQGDAREAYRNEQYELLRQRAGQAGYAMPESPPWAQGEQVASAPAAAGAEDPHAGMREKMRAHREALLEAADNPPASATADASQADPAPAQTASAPAPAAEPPAAPESQPTDAPAASAAAPGPEAVKTAETAPAETAAVPATPVPPTPAAPATAPAAPERPEPPTLGGIEPPEKPLPPERPAAPKPPEAPVQVATPAAPTPPAPPAAVAAPEAPVPTPAPASPAETASVQPAAPAAPADDAMTPDPEAAQAYRQQMRERFDAYMAERQAQLDGMATRQSQGQAGTMPPRPTMPTQPQPRYEQFQPPMMPNYGGGGMPYGYGPPPAMPYGQGYPGAYPGYGAPYWQQPPMR